jgi:hypothetical protein
MTWKIGAGDCKICLQLAFENPSHFLFRRSIIMALLEYLVRRQVPSPQEFGALLSS